MPSKLDEQLAYFKALLDGKSLSKDSPAFKAVVGWLRQFPGSIGGEDAAMVKQLICSCFNLNELDFLNILRGAPEEEIQQAANYTQIEKDFDDIVPRSGFLRDYVEFTRNIESPYAFHLYSALLGVGAAVNRKVSIDMAQFKVFPSMGVMLLGPSGVKKNTATDIIVGLLQEAELLKIYQEKLTPEGLIESMKGEANAVGLVYAPEMSVFLGKQRYLEGLVPLLTRFMDCPSEWASGTIMRGNAVLRNIGISCLFGSTPDWFIKNTPADTFGGGFIARYLLVVQHGSPRIFAIPAPVQSDARVGLMAQLRDLHGVEGTMVFAPEVYSRETGKERGVYAEWYHEFKHTPIPPEHEVLVSYYSRKPIHLLRLAMIFHLATHGDLELCADCFQRAVKLCAMNEKFLPGLMRQMFRTNSGEEQELVVNHLRKAGGVVTHTDIIRKLQYKMKASQTKEVLSSLKEAELVKEVRDNISHRYILVEMMSGKDK